MIFSPSAPLPFGTVLGIRIQNLLSASGITPLSVRVCTARTEAPPIAEVVWDRLTSPTGTQLLGASLYAADLANLGEQIVSGLSSNVEGVSTDPARRGHYKIFLGMAAGVGKTYRMLQ